MKCNFSFRYYLHVVVLVGATIILVPEFACIGIAQSYVESNECSTGTGLNMVELILIMATTNAAIGIFVTLVIVLFRLKTTFGGPRATFVVVWFTIAIQMLALCWYVVWIGFGIHTLLFVDDTCKRAYRPLVNVAALQVLLYFISIAMNLTGFFDVENACQ